jgi:hypothetical protein
VQDIFKIDTPSARNAIDENEYRQIYKITLPFDCKVNVLRAISKLEKIKGIKSAEPNYFNKLATVTEPDDPRYISGEQWGLNGTHGIKAPQAWNITTGSHNVRVGVIDTGIASHPDLNANLVPGWDF